MFFFFFKQKTAYEMRISDWSSDVCSSDLYLIVDQHHSRHQPGDEQHTDGEDIEHGFALQPEGIGGGDSHISKGGEAELLIDQKSAGRAGQQQKRRSRNRRGHRKDRKSTRLNSSH